MLRDYTIIAEVLVKRCYRVKAESEDAAKEIVGGDHEYLDYDIIEEELDTMEVEE